MRIVRTAEELPNLFHAAHTEAANAFGNGELYMEKFIEQPRHIEFQILADEHGNVATLFERECSIQRRHQKLIEEAPSLQVTPKMREEIGSTLCRCLTDIGYQNAGTVEFLMDEDRQALLHRDEHPHPGRAPRHRGHHRHRPRQSAVAHRRGRTARRHSARQLEIRGHAIECRINAEHPQKFTPSAGKITAFNVPGGNGVRVDTAQYAEGVVPPYYDSLIAKLIVLRRRPRRSHRPMERALSPVRGAGNRYLHPPPSGDLPDATSAPASSTPSSWSASSPSAKARLSKNRQYHPEQSGPRCAMRVRRSGPAMVPEC